MASDGADAPLAAHRDAEQGAQDQKDGERGAKPEASSSTE